MKNDAVADATSKTTKLKANVDILCIGVIIDRIRPLQHEKSRLEEGAIDFKANERPIRCRL